MGTRVEVLVQESQLREAFVLVKRLFETWEAIMSRFRPNSELSRLNQAAGHPVVVSSLLFHVISEALEAARVTDGSFDPTLGLQLSALGYDRTWDAVLAHEPEAPHVAFSPSAAGWRKIHLSQRTHTVHCPPGMALDLGGIAKGMAVDAAIAQLQRVGLVPALVNAGGDLAVVGHPPDQGWPIAVGDPPGRRVILWHGALATSGIGRHRWRQGSQMRHHIVDPATGQSVENDVWRVTVAALTAKQAEVAAKVAFVRGPARGLRFLADLGLSGEIELKNGEVRTVGDWPSGQEDRSQ